MVVDIGLEIYKHSKERERERKGRPNSYGGGGGGGNEQLVRFIRTQRERPLERGIGLYAAAKPRYTTT